MNNLQDALIRANLATEKQRKIEQPEKEKPAQKENCPHPRLTAPEFEKFEILFNTEKSKPFAIHLLYSFLPFPYNDYIWGWEDKKWKNGKKCCICGLETLSRDDIFKNFDKHSGTAFEGLISSIKDKNFNLDEFYKTRKQELFGDRLMGVTSQKTSCILCAPCYETFANWVNTKMWLGDCSFLNLITKIRMANSCKVNDSLSV